jgi:imidazolonepropionase-like amidohydrolase
MGPAGRAVATQNAGMRIFTVSMLTVLAAACGAAARSGDAVRAPLDGNSFVVANVRVFDGERVFEHINVVVRSGRIVAVGDGTPPADLPVVDGAGRTLLPGLIDAHAHVASEVELRSALQYGVTTQLDMFTDVAFLQAHRAQRDRLTKTELADLYSAGAPVTSAGGMGTQFGFAFPTIDGPGEATAFVQARLAEGSAYIKIMYEPDAGIVTTIPASTLAAVVAAARAQGAVTTVHVTSLAGARAVADAGADGFAHGFGDQPIDDALIQKIASRRMFVTATLSAHAYLGGAGIGPTLAADPRIAPFLTDRQRKQLTASPPGKHDPMAPYLVRFDLARASENVRRLHAAGVEILAGDDAASFGAHGVSLHGELELLTRAGLTPAQALTAATLAPARAFKLADRGRISPGARADLVLVDGNPLVEITQSRAIVRIFKNGYEVPRTRR